MIAALALLGAAALGAASPLAAAALPESVTLGEGERTLELHLARLVENGEFVSGFGWRRHPMGGGGAHHDGIDIRARRGTPVHAAAAGTIAQVGWGRDFGRFVRVRHEAGYETIYAHLGRMPRNLRAGHEVGPDDIIGFVGSTGRSTGPHLHFELRRDGKPLDPVTGEPRRVTKKAKAKAKSKRKAKATAKRTR